ncbi:DNA repair protein RecN [Clostridiaceae bacterium JG1575]|nr:DNA repair protein RecN [Clostridiaceae bacterium JG1575]
MLKELSVTDFALMEELNLHFESGFTVLTGETGAGKSILIDAISYVLGTKFNREFIRTGAKKTSVRACFDPTGPVEEILRREGIPLGDEVVLARENHESGKSVASLNGQPVLVSLIREVGRHLLDLHGQHNNQRLLDPSAHGELLDAYGHILEHPAFLAYARAYETLMAQKARLDRLTRGSQREHLLDFLTFQTQEIQKQGLSCAEEETLRAKEKRLAHAQRIGEAVAQALLALSEESLQGIEGAGRSLRGIADVLPEASPIASAAESAFYTLEEARHDLARVQEDLYYDPQELDEVNARLYVYETLQKKYGATTEKVLAECQRMEEELYELTHAQALIEALTAEIQTLEKTARALGEALAEVRRDVAKTLGLAIEGELAYVGLKNSRFLPEVQTEEAFTPLGTDRVHFLISTNTGEPLKPLEKVVSGGELSRIMLAIKSVFLDKEGTPTVIFDEIDTGISGPIASAVGEKMVDISEGAQALCVTHLPQIAAWSDHHLIAHKAERKGRTFSFVQKATLEEKTAEIAKMLGGADLTENIVANAKDMMAQAQGRKKTKRAPKSPENRLGRP